MTAMAMGGKGSGSKGSARDAELIRAVGDAHRNKPPAKVVTSWKGTVKKAVAAKKKK